MNAPVAFFSPLPKEAGSYASCLLGAVNLDGWTLEDASGHTYTFDHYRLAGRATVCIHTGEGRDARTDLYQDRRNYVWNNDRDHDTATLSNDRGRFIDDESWGHDRDRDRDHRHGDARH